MAVTAILMLFPSLNAQTPSTKPPAYTFRTLGVDCAPEGLHYLSGSNNITLSISRGMRSMPQAYDGASPITFFRTITGNDGHMTNIPVVSVDISRSGSFPLLLFLKGATDSAPPRVTVLPEDSSSFPGGTFRFFNNSANPLMVNFGASKLIVPPYAIANHKSESEVLTLEVSSQEPTGLRPVMRANVGILPDSRILILAIPSKTPGAPLELQRHADVVPGR